MRSVGTVGRWSIRHPWLAIVAWLAFVVLAVAALAATGAESLNNGAVGESERGYALMDEDHAWPPAREYGYLRSDTLPVGSAAFRSAIAAVRERMGVVAGNQINVDVSADRHSALVVGAVSDFGPLDQTHQAILDLQGAHPAITIAETGDIAANDA